MSALVPFIPYSNGGSLYAPPLGRERKIYGLKISSKSIRISLNWLSLRISKRCAWARSELIADGVDFVVIQEGAFDEVIKGVDAVEHTSSPVTFNLDDPDGAIVSFLRYRDVNAAMMYIRSHRACRERYTWDIEERS